ncbi:MAG: hypothetical protein AB8B52_11020 [Winogradskyella sp.]|uniref:hypothetical protein n=1 Tax=Winogradskyella sp. TaxID=1883156 RepID=UPI00385B1097
MKYLLTLFAITLFNTSSAQFFETDDFLHFGVGAIFSGATYSIVYNKTKNKKKAFWYSFGATTLLGLSKEIHDGYIISGKFDTGEAVATSIGSLSANYTFNIFTGKRKKKKQDKTIALLTQ